MLLLVLAAAGLGLYVWKHRARDGTVESPECDQLDAEIQGIVDRQNQVVANIAATSDKAKLAELVHELQFLELAYNEKVAQQAGMPDCEPWGEIWPPE